MQSRRRRGGRRAHVGALVVAGGMAVAVAGCQREMQGRTPASESAATRAADSGAVALASPPASSTITVPGAEPEDGQWVRPAKDYASTRFSGLDQITTANVASLKLAWTFSTGVLRGQEAAPLVVGSTMYVVTPYPNILYALDLSKPGAPARWKYEPQPLAATQGVACCDVVNRGAVYADAKIFYNTLDNQTVVNVVRALARGSLAGADPWGGETLEWATSSPAPDYNFAHIPVVRGRSALWAAGNSLDVVTGLREDRREVLQTTMLDAEPDSRHEHPDPTITPLLAALATGVTLIGGIFDPMGFVVGGVLGFFALIAWGWPRPEKPGTHEIVELPK